MPRLAKECLRRTIVFIWSAVQFPPGNKAIKEAAEKWAAAMGAVFARRNSFFLAHFKGGLYFEDIRLDDHDEMSLHFLRALSSRRIRKVVIQRGATPEELEKFSRLLAGKAVDLVSQGGPRHLLERLGVRNIQVMEEESRAGGADDSKGEYWEVKLGKLGLDQGEILAFLSGKGRLPRLLTDELRLLVEAMKDPVFLAQVIAHLAKEDGKARQPSPREIFRLANRFQYILAGHALFSPAETPRCLRRGLQALDPDLRLVLLAEKVGMGAEDGGYVEESVFGFSPQEYARWLTAEFERKGSWREVAAPLRAGPARAGAMARAFRAAMLTSPACPDEESVEKEVAALENGLAAPLELPRTSAGSNEPFPTPPPSAIGKAVQAAMFRCPEDLENGYSAALLEMLHKAQRPSGQVLDRLMEIVERRIANSLYPEALGLLSRLLPPDLDAGQEVRRRNRIQANLPEQAQSTLMEHVAQQLLEGEAEAPGQARLLFSLFGEEFSEQVAARCFSDHKNEPSPALLTFAAAYEDHCLPFLLEKLKSREPFDRIRALEMLSAIDTSAAQAAVLSAVGDHDQSVRLMALLSMGRGTNAAGHARLMDIARRNPRGEAAENERCAAVIALGRLGYPPAIPLLEDILARKGWFHSPLKQRVEACAALALKEISQPEALDALRRHLGAIGLSKLDMLRRRGAESGHAGQGEGTP